MMAEQEKILVRVAEDLPLLFRSARPVPGDHTIAGENSPSIRQSGRSAGRSTDEAVALGVSSATLPEVTIQRAGLIPILSFTADEIRWVQPR
jgi:hypothetical protein